MKKIILILAILFLSAVVNAQYGDAYHAPNTVQLSLDRQKRMAAADNAHYDNMRSDKKSTSSTTEISGDYNAYGWADYSRMKERDAAEKRQNERLNEWAAKERKLEALIKSRNLKREPQYHAQLLKAAKEAGFDDYSASIFFGHNPQEYEQKLLKQKLAENGAYSGGTKINCQGDCVETLKAYNGDVYVGNTLNGKPHGKGKYKTKATNIDVEGNFVNGQIDGLATAKGENYTASGTFKMGKQIGVHTITTQEENNIIGTYKVNFDNMESCSYSGSDGMSFNGTMDAAYNFIKGDIVYGSGIKFKGYFKDNSPYRGTWIKEYRIMVGEFAAANDGTLYLKYGYLDNQKDKIIYQGNFGPGMKKIGFVNQQTSDGTVTELYYAAPEVEEYVCIYFASGTKMYLKARADGEDYIGVQNIKDDNGGSIPVRYSKKTGLDYLKAEEKNLIEKSSQYAKEAIAKMKQGQAEYNKNLENVAEFFK